MWSLGMAGLTACGVILVALLSTAFIASRFFKES
jgi:hypothetical protein